MLIKYMCDWKSQTLRMHYPFQSTHKPILHQNLFSLHVYRYRCEILYRSEILAPVQQLGWTHTRVTLAGMTFCVGIM